MGSRWNRVSALAILSLLPVFAGCHEQASASEGAQAPSGETWLTAEQVRSAQIETAPASEHAVDDAVVTTGRVTFDDLRVAHVYSPVTGRVASVRAALGQRVKRGDVLATIASPDIGQWSSDVHKANADYIAAEHDFKRKSELLAVNAVAQAVYESAEDSFRQAKAEKERAEQKAHLLKAGSVDTVSQGFGLSTPIDGEVIARNLNPGIEVQGQYANGSAVELFTIGELDKVWILADVYESDLARVAVGAKVNVKVLAYPDKTFEGTVDWVAGALDPQTRTAHVRCTFANPDRLLKPEMYASVRIVASQAKTALSVPRSAVVKLGETSVVYAQAGSSPDGRVKFERLPVAVDDTIEGAFVPVEHGLDVGAQIVTRGAQALATSAL